MRMRTKAATLALALAFCSAACRGGDAPKPSGDVAADSSPAAPADLAKLDSEIERLERQVERNPADEDTREELAATYVRRGDARRASQRLKEALADYRQAMKYDLDSEEAIRNSAELSPLVEGTPEPGEYGEPAPLPISPNVTGEEAAGSPTPEKK